MTTPSLTRRQRQILDFLEAYDAEHSISPTLEEIASHFGVNKVTIFGHVAELERKGFLRRSKKGVSRGLQLVSPQSGSQGELETTSGADDTVAPATRLSILGRIAAGAPIETVEAPEEFDLEDLVPRGRDVYALRVQGDSMIGDGINDGDVVLVERRETAHNGEMVVAVLPEEEATLKRFYKERNGFRLQPANEALEPIFVDEVTIRGVVIGVVRRY